MAVRDRPSREGPRGLITSALYSREDCPRRCGRFEPGFTLGPAGPTSTSALARGAARQCARLTAPVAWGGAVVRLALPEEGTAKKEPPLPSGGGGEARIAGRRSCACFGGALAYCDVAFRSCLIALLALSRQARGLGPYQRGLGDQFLLLIGNTQGPCHKIFLFVTKIYSVSATDMEPSDVIS